MPHTPGPWEQRDTPGYNDTEIWAGKMPVAKVRDGDYDSRLIAAAPDMLAALEAVANWTSSHQSVFEQVRAAIAKATDQR